MVFTTIQFEELKADVNQLVEELGSRDARRPAAVSELRKHQIDRLEENIALLRRKQEQFNHKMEVYIGSLEKLLSRLGGPDGEDERSQPDSEGTHVRCVGCGLERVFPDVDVLLALEPEELLSRATEVIVKQEGKLKKGVFRCPTCGDANLTIKARGGPAVN